MRYFGHQGRRKNRKVVSSGVTQLASLPRCLQGPGPCLRCCVSVSSLGRWEEKSIRCRCIRGNGMYIAYKGFLDFPSAPRAVAPFFFFFCSGHILCIMLRLGLEMLVYIWICSINDCLSLYPCRPQTTWRFEGQRSDSGSHWTAFVSIAKLPNSNAFYSKHTKRNSIFLKKSIFYINIFF